MYHQYQKQHLICWYFSHSMQNACVHDSRVPTRPSTCWNCRLLQQQYLLALPPVIPKDCAVISSGAGCTVATRIGIYFLLALTHGIYWAELRLTLLIVCVGNKYRLECSECVSRLKALLKSTVVDKACCKEHRRGIYWLLDKEGPSRGVSIILTPKNQQQTVFVLSCINGQNLDQVKCLVLEQNRSKQGSAQ